MRGAVNLHRFQRPMSSQLEMFPGDRVASVPPPALPADWDPRRDMTCQPKSCEECGAPYRREGAFLFCRSGHERYIESVGLENHPRYEEFAAYRRAIGHPID